MNTTILTMQPDVRVEGRCINQQFLQRSDFERIALGGDVEAIWAVNLGLQHHKVVP